jgi:hypothetical protein
VQSLRSGYTFKNLQAAPGKPDNQGIPLIGCISRQLCDQLTPHCASRRVAETQAVLYLQPSFRCSSAMAARRLIPLLDRVLVERVVAPTKSAGGVLLPDSALPKVLVGSPACTLLHGASVPDTIPTRAGQ